MYNTDRCVHRALYRRSRADFLFCLRPLLDSELLIRFRVFGTARLLVEWRVALFDREHFALWNNQDARGVLGNYPGRIYVLPVERSPSPPPPPPRQPASLPASLIILEIDNPRRVVSSADRFTRETGRSRKLFTSGAQIRSTIDSSKRSRVCRLESTRIHWRSPLERLEF